MLESRYLHLHEALGLGPMWFKRDASVQLPSAEIATADEMPSAGLQNPQQTDFYQKNQAIEIQSAWISDANAQTASFHQPNYPATHVTNTPNNALSARENVLAWMETQKNQRQTPTRVAPAKPEIAIKTLEQCLAELQGKISAKKLILISLCPSSTNAVARHGFNEQENILLCNMLAAIDLPLENAHLCSWLPHFNVSPNAELLQQHLPRLQAECQLTQAQAVVFIGKFANEANYQNGLAMLPSNAPRFVLPHPARLLAQPHLKADAWQILKKIKSAIQ